jgi:excinuclease UvrABC helicase subunit UvrB
MSNADDIRLAEAVNRGYVLYFIHDGFVDKETRHYFVVLNENKRSDEILVLTWATSQEFKVLERMKRYEPGTVVDIYPKDYKEFTKRTYFDCNSVRRISRRDLLAKIVIKQLRVCDPLPDETFQRIREAVLKSKRVDIADKILIDHNYKMDVKID